MSKSQSDDRPWWDWVQANLDRLGWTTSDLTRQTDLEHVRFSRWRKGDRPSVDSIRTVAQAFDRADPDVRVPLLDALVAAEIITEEEANARGGAGPQRLLGPQELAKVSTAELLREINRRIPTDR